MIYRGPLQLRVLDIVWGSLACLLVVGIPMFLLELVRAKKALLEISDSGIRLTRGIVIRRTDVMDIARIRDVALSTAFGRSSLTIHSSDSTTPTLDLCFPGADQAFDRLTEVIRITRQHIVTTRAV